jgi:hypothetical protein
MKNADIAVEIRSRLKSEIDAGRTVQLSWFVQGVLQDHSDISGDDHDWYVVCAREHVWNTARHEVQRYKAKPIDRQGDFADIVAEGFRIQKAYLVDRDGERCLVPLADLTTIEVHAKVSELEQMASGCMDHADELRRWLADHAPSQRMTPSLDLRLS